MRVAFLHPDLGLGGAERLIVDAAAGMAARGHAVRVFTSHYDPARSFEETRDGRFAVTVHGDWLPRQVCGGRFHIVFAILRSLWLAVAVALFHPPADVYVVDQVSAAVPVLRLLRPRARILFYLHFPDFLLTPNRTALWKRLYRLPFDAFEQATTLCAHRIVVNSGFTRDVFLRTFTTFGTPPTPSVLYPCIKVPEGSGEPASSPPPGEAPFVVLSINRYERKKAIHLAIHAFARLRASLPAAAAARTHLVIAGGYDARLHENVEHYRELQVAAAAAGLVPAGATYERSVVPPALAGLPLARAAPDAGFAHMETSGPITWLRSVSDDEKTALLRLASVVLYTPSNEHFGIVPLEAMAYRRPVVAVASGGPLESVQDDGVTGYLVPEADGADGFARALRKVLDAGATGRAAMGERGRRHVVERFTRDAFAAQLEALCGAMR